MNSNGSAKQEDESVSYPFYSTDFHLNFLI
jgi:hypothetical protein